MKQLLKCQACGYEHVGQWTSNGYENSIGDESFYEILSEHKFKIQNNKHCEHGEYDYEKELEVKLYACPKCGTVRIEKE